MICLQYFVHNPHESITIIAEKFYTKNLHSTQIDLVRIVIIYSIVVQNFLRRNYYVLLCVCNIKILNVSIADFPEYTPPAIFNETLHQSLLDIRKQL